MRPLLVLFLLSSTAVQAAPAEALKPMAFLAGHCWKGEFPDGKQTDEHCFSWILNGHALRDVHTVRTPGKPDYVGEAIYHYDSAAKVVSYLYVENDGGFSRGTMKPTATGLEFPEAQYINGSMVLPYRVQWTVNANSYEAFSEMYVKEKWITQFKMVLKRQ
ncbi:hypothetical protein SAMN05216319_4206 [Duganella sp. CF402]|uniref:hypothetical protein n=1 Tax=unclassified Duganella TaxID=2636909 RepID=UPI0008CC79F8|nr:MULTISPECIES: hypothetical protein [unclassified Duganella]RZT04017.1 hypothetical protein EV582_4898 [Duganella sp. BK701]SEM51301.1 hypothetical protein SAMN05216319_4206 [Duganella sp. CF402]